MAVTTTRLVWSCAVLSQRRVRTVSLWKSDPATHRLSGIQGQIVEQCPGIPQIGGVEALGEPAVDRREQLVSRRVTVMVAPEPGEANSGAIPRAWLPVLGQCSGPGGTAPRQPRCTPAQLQLAFAPIQLGGKPALAGPFDDTQCIVQQTHRLRELRGNVARARQ